MPPPAPFPRQRKTQRPAFLPPSATSSTIFLPPHTFPAPGGSILQNFPSSIHSTHSHVSSVARPSLGRKTQLYCPLCLPAHRRRSSCIRSSLTPRCSPYPKLTRWRPPRTSPVIPLVAVQLSRCFHRPGGATPLRVRCRASRPASP